MRITIPASANQLTQDLMDRVEHIVKQDVDFGSDRLQATSSPFWRGLHETGSELWLDTGDLAAADALWCEEFSALTTNNSLLNKEIQKGIYDQLVAEADTQLAILDEPQRLLEIAFILNAHHGLRLASRFGGKVSVELDTDLAHDVERSVFYGLRSFRICPERFIVKVPLTPSGLIAARQLRAAGVIINFTLGFSARQNHVAAVFARPNWVNVFLGRLNSYVKHHGLGSGDNVGEKACLASQRAVRAASEARGGEPTRQIAASLREAGQIRDLAGVDVFTMPTAVAEEAQSTLDGHWADRSQQDYPVDIPDAAKIRADVLWEVSDAVRDFANTIDREDIAEPEALIQAAHDAGLGDLFPRWRDGDLATIAKDGKIPDHPKWAQRIESGELAIDTLLNAAGLAAFTQDQGALNDRIRECIRD